LKKAVSWEKADDGVFFMTLEEFLQYFD